MATPSRSGRSSSKASLGRGKGSANSARSGGRLGNRKNSRGSIRPNKSSRSSSDYRNTLRNRVNGSSKGGNLNSLNRRGTRPGVTRNLGSATKSTRSKNGPRTSPSTYSHKPGAKGKGRPNLNTGGNYVGSNYDGCGYGHDYDYDYGHNHHRHHHHRYGWGFHFGFGIGLGYFSHYGYYYRPWYYPYFRHSYYYPWYGYSHYPYYWSYSNYASSRYLGDCDYISYANDNYYGDALGYNSDPYLEGSGASLSPEVVDESDEGFLPFGNNQGLTLAPEGSLSRPLATGVQVGANYSEKLGSAKRYMQSGQHLKAAEAARLAYIDKQTPEALLKVGLSLLAAGDYPLASWSFVQGLQANEKNVFDTTVWLNDYVGGPATSRSLRGLEGYLVDNPNDEASSLLLGSLYIMTGRDYAGHIVLSELEQKNYETETIGLFISRARQNLKR
ncbi:MAG: hypothetical protein V3W41_10880 [Planctomycetota bacterium]